MISLMIVLLFY